MKTTQFYKVTIDYGFGEPIDAELRLEANAYRNNNTLAIVAYDRTGEEFDTITVNLPYGFAGGDMAYVDTNNCPWAEAFLKKNKVASPTGIYGESGFCAYPLYIFDMSKFEEQSNP